VPCAGTWTPGGCLLGWLWGSAAPPGAQSRVGLRFSLPGPGLREPNPPPQPGSLRTRESIVAGGLGSARPKVADFGSLFHWSPALKCATNTIRGCPGWVGPERQTRWGVLSLPRSSWPWLGRWAGLNTATITNTPLVPRGGPTIVAVGFLAVRQHAGAASRAAARRPGPWFPLAFDRGDTTAVNGLAVWGLMRAS
jgi:hypothetical protein